MAKISLKPKAKTPQEMLDEAKTSAAPETFKEKISKPAPFMADNRQSIKPAASTSAEQEAASRAEINKKEAQKFYGDRRITRTYDDGSVDILVNGSTFHLTEEQYAQDQGKKPLLPERVQPVGAETRQAMAGVAGELPNVAGEPAPETFDIGKAVTGAAIAAAPAAITALAGGPGAAAGALAVGAAAGIFTKLRSVTMQGVKEDTNVFNNAKANMATIINEVNAGRASATEAQIYWQQQLVAIARSKRNLKAKTQNSVSNFLGKPGDDLRDVEDWEVNIEFMRMQLMQAMARPNPTSIITLPAEAATTETFI